MPLHICGSTALSDEEYTDLVLRGQQIPVAIPKRDGTYWFVSKRPEFMRPGLEPFSYRDEIERWLYALHEARKAVKRCGVDGRLVHVRWESGEARAAHRLAKRLARERAGRA